MGKSHDDIPQRPATAVERFSGQALCEGDDIRRRGPWQTPGQVRRAIGEIEMAPRAANTTPHLLNTDEPASLSRRGK